MGKNFSANNSRGLRKKSDFYETPYSLTDQFLKETSWYKTDSTLEPACGNGAIVKMLWKNYFTNVIAYDINKNSDDTNQSIDFLKETRHFSQCITNPPFSLAKEFILKAKEIIDWRFAFLLPLSYLHGKERYDLKIYDELESVYIFTRYPMLGEPLREDGKYHTGMMVYAWYVWSIGWHGSPTIKWIDNDEYVLRKKEESPESPLYLF